MGFKLSEIEENTRIVFHIHHGEQQMDLGGILKKHLQDNLALITLDYKGSQRLVFENVKIDMEFPQDNGVPLIWRNVKIINHQVAYVLQVFGEGVRNNRRNSFRISVGKQGWFSMKGRESCYVTIKDVSASGFSISDRKQELKLAKGDQLSVSFEDLGYRLDLVGKVVRIEKREDMMVYGMVIINICNDLSTYINIKQRPTRR